MKIAGQTIYVTNLVYYVSPVKSCLGLTTLGRVSDSSDGIDLFTFTVLLSLRMRSRVNHDFHSLSV